MTSKIDMDRLINSITIVKKEEGEYVLCYDIRAINEIKAALHIKNFQQENVINHHTVVYEQALLKKAVESAVLYEYNISHTDDPDKRRIAMENICKVNGFLGALSKGDWANYPTDDFFICLMRKYPDDKYINEWFSRKYRLRPIWKSRERFWLDFKKFNLEKLHSDCWLYSKKCIEYLAKKFNIEEHDIWIENATPKNKMATLTDLKILINGQIINYTNFFSKETLLNHELLSYFKFIFIPVENRDGEILDFEKIRKALIKEFFTNTYE